MSGELLVASVEGGLSLLNNLLQLMIQAKQSKSANPSIAEIVEKLPGEAYGIAKQIAEQLINLKANLDKNGVDLKLSLDELESSFNFWEHRWDKIPRKANTLTDGLKNHLVVLLDDFVAVARCAGMGDQISGSYKTALQQKKTIRALSDTSKPVGELLDSMIDFSEEMAAQFGEM